MSYPTPLLAHDLHDKDAVFKAFSLLHTQNSPEVKSEHGFGHIDITFVYSKHKNYRRGLPFQQCKGIASVRS